MSSASSQAVANAGSVFLRSYARVRLIPAAATAAVTLPVSARTSRKRACRALVNFSRFIRTYLTSADVAVRIASGLAAARQVQAAIQPISFRQNIVGP